MGGLSTKPVPKPKAIIMDIEGTTTDRKYFSHELMPVIKKNLNKLLAQNYDKPETKQLIANLKKLQSKYKGMPAIEGGGKDKEVASVEKNIIWQMKSGFKTTELKSAELLAWVWAYESNLLKGHVFDDVSPTLHQWKVVSGIQIGVYSSAKTCAQNLLFCNTNHGNLTPLIDQYFDNIVGVKEDPKSYETICRRISADPKSVLYITDKASEANCAKTAGLTAVMIKRPNNRPQSAIEGVQTISSFKDIKFN